MNDSDETALLVIAGSLSSESARQAGCLSALVVPPLCLALGLGGASLLAADPSPPRTFGAAPMGVFMASLAVALLWPIAVAVFMGSRSESVTILADRIVWGASMSDLSPAELSWDAFEGFHDTPHPWIEIRRKDGTVRTIPAPSEPMRLRTLELLAHFLPDLAVPSDERPSPRST